MKSALTFLFSLALVSAYQSHHRHRQFYQDVNILPPHYDYDSGSVEIAHAFPVNQYALPAHYLHPPILPVLERHIIEPISLVSPEYARPKTHTVTHSQSVSNESFTTYANEHRVSHLVDPVSGVVTT